MVDISLNLTEIVYAIEAFLYNVWLWIFPALLMIVGRFFTLVIEANED